jgi:uncharacterized protein
MKDFFNYFKNPLLTEKREKFSLNIFLNTMGICYVLLIPAGIPFAVFKYFNVLPHYRTPDVHTMAFFLVVVVLGPLFEETLFRLNLRISKLNISAFVAAIMATCIKLLFIRQGSHYYFYIMALPLFGLIYLIISRFDFSTNKLELFWKSNFKYVFHFSAISFGMIHLFNFDSIHWWMILTAPLWIAPLATLGYIIGYVRIKYGFLFGWLIHATFNLGSTLSSLHLLYVVVLFYAFALILNYLLKRNAKPVPD